ncbi:hypothetical protein D9M68_581950 [compost metagenome]
MKKVTRPKYVPVPKEFDLSRYSELRDLPDKIFGGLLEYRRQLWFGCLNNPNLTCAQTGNLTAAIGTLLASPLGRKAHSFSLKNKDRIAGELLSEPSVNDLILYAQAFEEFKQEAAEERPDFVFSASDPAGRYFGAISPNHMRTVYPDRFKKPEFLIKVNLDARDDELVECFKELLFNLRAIRKFPEPDELRTERTESIKNKIIHNNSVPYIDLIIWSKFHGVRIKTAALAKALFPGLDLADGGKRRLNEVTDKYADKALSAAFVQSLQQ